MRLDSVNRRAIADLVKAPQVVDQEERMAEAILDRARDLVPVRTGRTRRSLTVVRVDDGDATRFRIGWDLSVSPAGPLLEFGTIDTEAQPHLRPAADEINRRT